MRYFWQWHDSDNEILFTMWKMSLTMRYFWQCENVIDKDMPESAWQRYLLGDNEGVHSDTPSALAPKKNYCWIPLANLKVGAFSSFGRPAVSARRWVADHRSRSRNWLFRGNWRVASAASHWHWQWHDSDNEILLTMWKCHWQWDTSDNDMIVTMRYYWQCENVIDNEILLTMWKCHW